MASGFDPGSHDGGERRADRLHLAQHGLELDVVGLALKEKFENVACSTFKDTMILCFAHFKSILFSLKF